MIIHNLLRRKFAAVCQKITSFSSPFFLTYNAAEFPVLHNADRVLTIGGCAVGKVVSFHPVVYFNKLYLGMIGVVAFITQLQLLHLLRYHRTISILGQTLSKSLLNLLSFGFIMGIIFLAFAMAIYLLYHDLQEYSTISNTMGAQVRSHNSKCLPDKRTSDRNKHETEAKPFRFKDVSNALAYF